MSNVATPVGGTEQSELVTVVVDGTSLGKFDTWSGGDAMAPGAKHRSGGQLNERSYQTLPKYSDLVVSRVLDLAVDWELVRLLKTKAGRVPGSVTLQPLDVDLNAYGDSQTASGLFLGVGNIRGDSNSETLQMFELHFSVDGWQ